MKNESRRCDPELAREMKSLIAGTRLTNEALAERLGVTPRMLYYYQQGRSEPRASVYKMLVALAR